MPLRLVLLGTPGELIQEDDSPIKFANSKHLALVAHLTLEPGDYSREELTRFMWSSGDPGSMNDALSALRGVFGKEAFPHRATRIQFDPQLVDCDAARLRTARTDPTVGAEVLSLYRGPFLEDFNERGAGYRLTRWVENTRKEMEDTFLVLCDRACEEAASREAWDEVEGMARRGLRHVPGWEAGARWLAAAAEAQRPPAPEFPVREVLRAPTLPAAAEESVAAAASSPAPVSAAPSIPTPTPAPAPAPAAPPESRRGRQRAVVLAVLLLLGLAGAGTWIWRTTRSASPAAEARSVPLTARRPAAGSAAPLCGPGEAAGQLVDEVFFYGTRVRPGRPFRKAWVLQNTGGCTWGTDFRLHFVGASDERLSRTMMDIPLETPLPPGVRDTFEVPMQAPGAPGEYGETWQVRDGGDRPVRVGETFFLRAGITVPLPHYPPCGPGQGTGLLLVRKFPPGAVMEPGARFRYSWTIKNTAECAWSPGTTLRFRSHARGRLSRIDAVVPTRTVEPDETYTFLVPMQAPRQGGVYQEAWELEGPGRTPIPVGGRPTLGMQIRVAGREERPSAVAPVCGPGQAQIRFYDENWRDSTRVRPGQTFIKRWTVLNSGPCTWDADFVLRYSHNEGGQLAVSRADKPLGQQVPPETAYTFEVPMRVPAHRGYIRENWRLLDDRGGHIIIGTSPYLAAILIVEAK